jgi:hypothetical protein
MASAERSTAPALSVATALCLLPLSASAQAPRGVRDELDALSGALDRAVRQVSRPAAFALAGRATQAYALPGVGAVFVLPPRALPIRRANRAADRQAARALADAMANLQESLRRVRTPELRAQIERSLEAVRQAQVGLRGLPRPAEGPVLFEFPEFPPMGDFAAEVEAELAAQARALREMQAASGDANRSFREQWEAEVRALHAQTDAFRREADRAREEAERALRTQLRVPWPEPPDIPPLPAAPEVQVDPTAPLPPAAPVPPAPSVPPAPPWSFWLESEEGPETGDADSVVAGVRDAVLSVLEANGRPVRLGAGDSLIVAVDFVPRAGSAAAPRTLVLRARIKDVEERRAGRLAAEEFRRRVEASEY